MTTRILVVCLGNICRSPMGQGVIEQRAVEAGLALMVDSAGLGAWHIGNPPNPRGLKVALARGYDNSRQRARQVRPQDFHDFDLILAADGVNSTIREELSERFEPTLDWRPNQFVWLGTTKPFAAFTFYFRETEHGLWRVHAYQYEPGRSTFIVECTEETWKAAGMDEATEADTLAHCQALFAEELEGHELIANNSVWRSFPTVRCAHWSADNVVLMGDAVHTAHFSIGSGTRLGMLGAIALRDALLAEPSVEAALAVYEGERRPAVESLQRAAQASLEWFEATERYMDLDPIEFSFTLLTRSLRITHEDLRLRDPDFLAEVDAFDPEGDPSGLDDDMLRLLFACCHPALKLDARVALTLRTVCGLSTAAIARALPWCFTTFAI